MGDAKRRRTELKEQYGNPDDERVFSWFPLTRRQAREANEFTTRGAWASIIILIVYWLTVRFIGPYFGWWQTVD